MTWLLFGLCNLVAQVGLCTAAYWIGRIDEKLKRMEKAGRLLRAKK